VYDCAYCKYQSRLYASGNEVHGYLQLHDQLREEVVSLRRRNLPLRMVLFNTTSDCFCGDSKAEEAAARCLEVLLTHDVFVNVSTKGVIPVRGLEVLARRPELSMVNYNLTALSDSFQRSFEPKVPPVAERLRFLKGMAARRLPVRGRIEPLIPMENDSAEAVEATLRAFKDAGVREVVVSYLVMDQSLEHRFARMLGRVHASMITHWFRDMEGSIRRYLPVDLRKRKYAEFKQIGAKIGVRVIVCACKNADIFTGRCFVLPSPVVATRQKGLLL
jgi:DNA repair photolyase